MQRPSGLLRRSRETPERRTLASSSVRTYSPEWPHRPRWKGASPCGVRQSLFLRLAPSTGRLSRVAIATGTHRHCRTSSRGATRLGRTYCVRTPNLNVYKEMPQCLASRRTTVGLALSRHDRLADRRCRTGGSRISAPDTTPLANEPEPSPESAATIDVDLSWRKRALIAAHQRWRDSELGRF